MNHAGDFGKTNPNKPKVESEDSPQDASRQSQMTEACPEQKKLALSIAEGWRNLSKNRFPFGGSPLRFVSRLAFGSLEMTICCVFYKAY